MRQVTTVTSAKLLAIVVAAVLSSNAFAVTSEEYNAGLQFNFSNPGARSLGMGGAYLGFSDDVTAAYTNPAGMTALSQVEVGLEYRATYYSTPFVAGAGSGVNSVFESESKSNSSGPSYFAAVFPGDGWAIGAYRNVELDFSNSFSKSEIPFTFQGISDRVILASQHEIEAKSVNYGLSGAYELSDQLSIGVSAVYTLFDTFGVSLRSQDGEVLRGAAETADAEAYSYNIGVLYKFDDKLSIGAAYRRGAEFDTKVPVLNNDNFRVFSGKFNIPHQFGLGVAYRATDAFALGFDAHYVQYDTLSEDPLRAATFSKVQFESGIELRLGAEYVFADFATPFTLRGGVWRDPDHRFAFEGVPANRIEFIDSLLFPKGDAEMHYALGLGWAFEKLQIDAGADFSNPVKTYSVSGVVRF
jgi:long-chain fatty acid transport protein